LHTFKYSAIKRASLGRKSICLLQYIHHTASKLTVLQEYCSQASPGLFPGFFCSPTSLFENRGIMDFTKEVFDLSVKSDEEAASLFQQHQIGLTVSEGRQLQEKILQRPPSLAELILFSIEGSEHCSYKSSRPYLKQFITEGEDVVLGAKEDAGVIRVARDYSGQGYCVVMSHESHNHPSQVVPYEGAATGVGGNVRDVCCMGAEVIALADDLRFGSVSSPHTKRLLEEVVSGIRGYANPIGVPSLAGGIQFDPGYQENCLVTVVGLGLLREDRIIHSYAPKDSAGFDLILVGKPTDNSGFGGASFASFELEEEKHEMNKGAVQEPNAFLGRHMIQASVDLFEKIAQADALEKVGFKDLGAGGISCASVELADTGGYGARIDIDRVHTSMEGLPAHVILCAETQERYMWVCDPSLTPMILDHYNRIYALPEVSRGACAQVIGTVTEEPQYVVHAHGEVIVDAPAREVTKGFLYHREVGRLQPAQSLQLTSEEPEDYRRMLLELLSHENIASQHGVFDTYDKQVQGRSLIEAGDSDAGVLTPFNSSDYPPEIRSVGITLTTDQNPRINAIDPALGGALAVVESVTNTLAAGAVPAAVSDCLCYGNPEKPDQMAQFAAGCSSVAETAGKLQIPVIAGNVSLYNESKQGAIPPSPMIACLGRLEHAEYALTSHFKAPGSAVYFLPCRSRPGMQGSIYSEIIGETGGELPDYDLSLIQRWGEVIRKASEQGSIAACHDLSEGGIAAAVCEMSFKNTVGCTIEADYGKRPDCFLFGEGPGFIAEIPAENAEAFLDLCRTAELSPERIGTTTEAPTICFSRLCSLPVEEAREAWYDGMERRLL